MSNITDDGTPKSLLIRYPVSFPNSDRPVFSKQQICNINMPWNVSVVFIFHSRVNLSGELYQESIKFNSHVSKYRYHHALKF